MLRLRFTATLGGCHFEIPIMSTLAMQIADACTLLTCQIIKLGQIQYNSYSALIGSPSLHYGIVHSISKGLHPSQPLHAYLELSRCRGHSISAEFPTFDYVCKRKIVFMLKFKTSESLRIVMVSTLKSDLQGHPLLTTPVCF